MTTEMREVLWVFIYSEQKNALFYLGRNLMSSLLSK